MTDWLAVAVAIWMNFPLYMAMALLAPRGC